jgi:hypothetical protein
VAFDLRTNRFRSEATRGAARTANSCRKSENRLSSSHEQFCPSAWPRPQAPVAAPLNARGRRAKIFFAKTPRNPLKSLDSDERIQGNPRESNPQKRGSSKRNAQVQENPNMSRLTNLSACRDEGMPAPTIGMGPTGRSSPGVCGGGLLFVRLDRRRLDQSQVDVIQALDQTLLAKIVELELDHAAVGAADFLRRQIDR